MDSTLLLVLTIFVGLTTIAMVAQAAAMIGMARVALKLNEKVNQVMPEVTKALDTSQRILLEAQRILQETQKHVGSVGQRATEMLDITKAQVVKIDELVSDARQRAKTQLDRAELVLDDTMGRTQHTVAMVQKGVIAPIREVHGVFSGVRAAIAFIGRGNRPTVDHATSDEEMFI